MKSYLFLPFVMFAAMLLMTLSSIDAALVTPQMGGGQVGMMGGAPMKHIDVAFDGTNIVVSVDGSVATPILRPLDEGDTFIDPGNPHPWDVLEGKAYNFQYGWNPSGFISLPTNAGIWVERLDHDLGLESYLRPPATPSYGPVFENDGDIWQWSGSMTHNVYAVENPIQSLYTATYRVYIGDTTTGEALPGFGSDDVTLTFDAIPVIPEPTSFALLALSSLAVLRRRRLQ